MSLLFLNNISQVLDNIDIINFPLIKEENKEEHLDISFIEGSVVQKDEIHKIKKIRKRSDIVVAIGACATYGGIPAIKDFGYEEDKELGYYPEKTYMQSVKVSGIGKYIKVDYFLRGCPPIKSEIERFLKDILINKRPQQTNAPVCIECRIRGNPCLLQQGELCMGPVTYGGCEALCTSNSIVCYGCRGPIDDANVDALSDLFKEQGITDIEIKKRFVMFAGTSKKFNEVGFLND